MLHPVHETVAEVEWNRDSGRLEVALRLDALDEQWLRKRMGSTKVREGEWEIAYLHNRFRISDRPREGEADSVVYRWVGRDEDRGHVWWYFEVVPADKKVPAWIENRVLFEKGENHAHRLVILGAVPKRTLLLTMQSPRAPWKQAENDESESDATTGR